MRKHRKKSAQAIRTQGTEFKAEISLAEIAFKRARSRRNEPLRRRLVQSAMAQVKLAFHGFNDQLDGTATEVLVDFWTIGEFGSAGQRFIALKENSLKSIAGHIEH